MTDRLALTVPEAAEAIGVDPSAVYRMIREGHLPAVKFPTMSCKRVPMWALRQLVGEPAATPELREVV